MADKYEHHQAGLQSPGEHIFAITPNDSADLATVTRAINVAAAGTVRVTTVRGTTADLYVAAGVAFPVRATRVWATGTDATGIVGIS